MTDELPETIDVRYRVENTPNEPGVTVDIGLENLPDDAVISGTIAEHIYDAFGIDVEDYDIAVDWDADVNGMTDVMPEYGAADD